MMTIRRITTCLGIAALTSVSLIAWAEEGAQAFTFRSGQRVYVTAFHTLEHSVSRSSSVTLPPTLIDAHLPAELRIRKDFQERQVYQLVDKASAADFVFLVLIDDSAAEGLAVAPAVFAEHKQDVGRNIEALREAAYARSTIGPLKLHNLGRLSDRLVKAFHEEKGRPTTANQS